MDTKQPKALTLAAELRAGNWAPNVLQNETALRDRAADELQLLHAENESLRTRCDNLRAGYDAARLEIASLQAQLEAVGAGGVGALMAAPVQPVDENDSECEAPPIGWRCTRTRGHDGPCAAVESQEDKDFVERGMRRIRDAADAARWHWLGVYLIGSRLDMDDEIVACESLGQLAVLVDTAIATDGAAQQGAKP